MSLLSGNKTPVRLWDRAAREVFAESALFLAEEGEISLLFPAEEVRRVCNRATGAEYRVGKDFSHAPGSDRIRRLKNSAIPFLDDAALHPTEKEAVFHPAPGANAVPWGVDGRNIRFDAGNFFAVNQIEVDYIAPDGAFSPGNELFPDRLPRLKAKLTARRKIRIAWLGDSISEGYNASGYLKKPPFQMPMAGLFAEGLHEDFDCEVELDNRGLNGAESSYPLEKETRTDVSGFDLLVIAFGMNDFHREDTTLYLHNIAEIIDRAQKSNPEIEILLLSSMSGNPAWKHTPPGPARLYADALMKFAHAAPASVACADNFRVWEQMLRKKNFFDLTGNGVNHPNDFGHRILANSALTLFTPDRLLF